MTATTPGVVSVVIVNFRGTDDTIEACRPHRRGRLAGRSARDRRGRERLGRRQRRAAHRGFAPRTRAHRRAQPENLGFAGGSNLGARRSAGEFVAFLNNDAKPDPGWIARRRRASSKRQPAVAAVGSKVLDWDGSARRLRRMLRSRGSAWATSPSSASADTASPRRRARRALRHRCRDVRARARSSTEVGGFDERVLHVLRGRRPRLAAQPQRLAGPVRPGDRSSSTSTTRSMTKLRRATARRYLLERNALFTLYKNLERREPRRVAPRRARRSRCGARSHERVSTPAVRHPPVAGAPTVGTSTPVPKESVAGALRDRPVRRDAARARSGSRRGPGRRARTRRRAVPLFGDSRSGR